MNFKEMIHKDLRHVFFNTNEFAEQHTLNGISVEVIIDNDRLKERSKKEYDGRECTPFSRHIIKKMCSTKWRCISYA